MHSFTIKTNKNQKLSQHLTVKTSIIAVNDNVVKRFSDKNKLPKDNLTHNNKNATEHF